jgi:hypothetical protein
MAVTEAQIAAQEERIERPHGQHGRESVDERSCAVKPRRDEEPSPERSPDIVEVTAYDDGRSVMESLEWLAAEKASELFGALGPGEAEVQVVDDDDPGVLAHADPQPSLQGAPLFSGADG